MEFENFSIAIDNKKLIITTRFVVKPDDFNIKIPSIVKEKIANKIQIHFFAFFDYSFPILLMGSEFFTKLYYTFFIMSLYPENNFRFWMKFFNFF